jgi:DNA-directed RNA polymerase subunit D
MKIQVEKLQPKEAILHVSDAPIYLINSLRRLMIAELPKLAINDVVIYDNTSALFDEIIAHRLGLVPIPTDLNLLEFRETCKCKGVGCPTCTVRYTLSKEGEGVVYSGDLQASEASWAITEDKIPIVELFGEQRLILEVEAVLGSGSQHAKWQPIIAPGYRFIPTIEFDSKDKEEVEELISELPEGIVTIKGNTLQLSDYKKLAIIESFIDKNRINIIKINKDFGNIVFHFETDGALKADDALNYAIDMFDAKVKELDGLLKKIKKK